MVSFLTEVIDVRYSGAFATSAEVFVCLSLASRPESVLCAAYEAGSKKAEIVSCTAQHVSEFGFQRVLEFGKSGPCRVIRADRRRLFRWSESTEHEEAKNQIESWDDMFWLGLFK